MSQNTGTRVAAAVRPNDSNDTYPSAWSNEVKGGHHMYATLADRNAIALARREWGMLCTVYNNGANNGTYQLVYGLVNTTITDNNNWQLFTTSGGGTVSAGNGLTSSSGVFSIKLDGATPGLTLSSSGLKVVDLIMTTSSVTLDTNILGQYTTDPVGLPGWGNLSIPNKGYVDAFASGLNPKQSVRVAATGSISLTSAPAQIDSVTLSSGDRVLIWQQDSLVTGATSNGIYVFNGTGSSMSRSADLDGTPSTEITTGVYTFVTEGSTYQGSGFVIVSSGTWSGNLPVDVAPIKWTQFSGAGLYNWNDGLISSGNNINVDLVTNGGLTFSASQLTLQLAASSGLTLSSGLAINSNLAGTGLTFASGQLSLTSPIYFDYTQGITSSGNTYSVNIDTNSGLSFNSNKIAVNAGTGLTFSAGVLVVTNTALAGDGLTNSGNTFSILLSSTSGLTLSNGELSIDTNSISSGLTFSGGLLSATPYTGGLGIGISGFTISTKVDSTSGLTNSTGTMSINWNGIVGNGLTWSGTLLSSRLVANSGLTANSSGLSIQLGSGSGLTLSSSALSVASSIAGFGLTWSNGVINTLLQANSGLTVSSNGLSLTTGLFGSGLTFSGGSVSVTIVAGSGLTSSGNTFSVLLQTNSGLTVSSQGIALNSNSIGSGLSFSSGQLSTTPYTGGLGIGISGFTISTKVDSTTGLTNGNGTMSINWNGIIGNGLTWSGLTLSARLGANSGLTATSSGLAIQLGSGSGLTVSSSNLSVASSIAGSGLTWSNGVISNSLTASQGLTFSGGSFSVLLQGNSGLTVSNSGIAISNNFVGTGLTFTGGSMSAIPYTAGNGIAINNYAISTKVDTTTGLYNSTGTMSINWVQVVGTGLSWSGSQINSTGASLAKYAITSSFTSNIPIAITHSLGTTDVIIQVYDSTSGDELFPLYSVRGINAVTLTLSETTTARVVIIG